MEQKTFIGLFRSTEDLRKWSEGYTIDIDRIYSHSGLRKLLHIISLSAVDYSASAVAASRPVFFTSFLQNVQAWLALPVHCTA